MEEAIYAVLKQVPALGLMVWMVQSFLNHMKSRDDLLRDIGRECHKVQEQCANALRDNSRILGRVEETLIMMAQEARHAADRFAELERQELDRLRRESERKAG